MRGLLRRPWLVVLAHLYLIGLALWAILNAVAGDTWWWLLILNSLAGFLFLPVPAVLAIGLAGRRRVLLAGGGLAVAFAGVLFGGLFLPRAPTAAAAGPVVAVMAYNLWGYTPDPGSVTATIRAAGPDIVGLAELTPDVAVTIRRDLSGDYPYQVLDPKPGVHGLGVISRYPLTDTGRSLDGRWIGRPQVVDVRIGETTATVVNFHALPPTLVNGDPEYTLREREQGARSLTDFVRGSLQPVIALGDFNAGDQTRAYRLLTSSLRDVWREAGWGPGLTWGSGGGGPEVGPPFRLWYARIDYVLFSRHWRAVDAQVGPWDGTSDHQPVRATLALIAE